MQLRDNNIAKLSERVFDALIIGGGINGAVSAAALSGKGASVALIDQRDFAGFTSQQSSNLAWGGIKYLENGDYGLVRKLCLSRNHLIESYPSRAGDPLLRHHRQGLSLLAPAPLARHLGLLAVR